MDRGAWEATAHKVIKSQTRLSNFTHSLILCYTVGASQVALVVKSPPAN